MNTVKFDQSELDKIKSLQDKYQELVVMFGRLNIDKILLDRSMKMFAEAEERAKQEFANMQKDESALMESLSAKYGNGVLSLKDGTFTPDNK